MKVDIIHSGSSGNLARIDETFVIDAGWRFDDSADFCLLTHHHTDHTKYLTDMQGMPIYCIQGTADALRPKYPFMAFHIVEPNKPFTVGGYVITPWEMVHDAPCVGYDIAREDKRIFYATDFCQIVDEERFIKQLKRKEFDALYIECNNTLDTDDMQELFFYEGDKPPKDEFHRRRSYNNHCNAGYIQSLFGNAGYSEMNRFTEPVTLLHKSSFYYGRNPERIVSLCKVANVINPLY